jgi:hypothetical protein
MHWKDSRGLLDDELVPISRRHTSKAKVLYRQSRAKDLDRRTRAEAVDARADELWVETGDGAPHAETLVVAPHAPTRLEPHFDTARRMNLSISNGLASSPSTVWPRGSKTSEPMFAN